jgi:hypothetical protein
METEVIFAVDAGSTALKAVAIGRDGTVHACAERPISTHSAPGGVSEQDMDEWWRAFEGAAVDVCRAMRARALRPVAVALCGQMQDVVLVDADARAVRAVMLYSDSRAQPQAAAIASRWQALGREGDRPQPSLPSVLAGYKGAVSLPPKLLWLAEHEPRALERASGLLLGAHSLLCARLLAGGPPTAAPPPTTAPAADAPPGIAHGQHRRFFVDPTTASTTGLLDRASGGWALGTLAQLLPRLAPRLGALLPEIVPADRPVGTVAQAVASSLGAALSRPGEEGGAQGVCAALGGLPLFHGAPPPPATHRLPSACHPPPPSACHPAASLRALPSPCAPRRLAHAAGGRDERLPCATLRLPPAALRGWALPTTQQLPSAWHRCQPGPGQGGMGAGRWGQGYGGASLGPSGALQHSLTRTASSPSCALPLALPAAPSLPPPVRACGRLWGCGRCDGRGGGRRAWRCVCLPGHLR